MDDQQQSRWRPTRRRLLWGVGIVAALAALGSIFGGYVFGWEWTGLVMDANFHKRTLWDWLQLLIIPAVLAAGGFWFNAQQRAREQQIASARTQDEALQAYLDQMSQLLSDKERPLQRSRQGDRLSTVARARTLTVLMSLDGGRKGSVVLFLAESGLISKDRVILDLKGADLRGANLYEADLPQIYLHGAKLSGANLAMIELSQANLVMADLRGANLGGARLWETLLVGADLRGAHLGEVTTISLVLAGRAVTHSADLSGADLSHANLSYANLRSAYFKEADLTRANLKSADFTGADLSHAKLERADFTGADLSRAVLSAADLSGADLSGSYPSQSADDVPEWVASGIQGGAKYAIGAQVTKGQLAMAKSLEGATMPTGQKLPTGRKYQDWLKRQGGLR